MRGIRPVRNLVSKRKHETSNQASEEGVAVYCAGAGGSGGTGGSALLPPPPRGRCSLRFAASRDCASRSAWRLFIARSCCAMKSDVPGLCARERSRAREKRGRAHTACGGCA